MDWLETSKTRSIWAVKGDYQHCGMYDQQSLRSACVTRSLIRAFASGLNILWVLSYWLNIIGVSKPKGRLQRLVWVYTCQNATLLEITCRGSYMIRIYGVWRFRVIIIFHLFQGIYDMHIHVQGVPILGWEPPLMSSNISARYVDLRYHQTHFEGSPYTHS